jgi:DoxX-like protein
MGRKAIYWVVTSLLALSAAFAGVNYLRGSQQAVQVFAHLGYPQQLRVLLGIAKLLGGITLIVPCLLMLKEWAYTGFTFAWIAAVVAHYLAKDGAVAFFPLILLVLLFVSYFTRPAIRRLGSKAAA